jgi:hypothetical protein
MCVRVLVFSTQARGLNLLGVFEEDQKAETRSNVLEGALYTSVDVSCIVPSVFLMTRTRRVEAGSSSARQREAAIAALASRARSQSSS